MNLKIFGFIALAFFSFEIFAEDMNTTIRELYTYTDGNVDGDIAVRTTESSSVCPGGFFVKNTDSASQKNMVSFLLSAYHTKANVRLIGEPTPWPASGGTYCQLTIVGLVP